RSAHDGPWRGARGGVLQDLVAIVVSAKGGGCDDAGARFSLHELQHGPDRRALDDGVRVDQDRIRARDMRETDVAATPEAVVLVRADHARPGSFPSGDCGRAVRAVVVAKDGVYQ